MYCMYVSSQVRVDLAYEGTVFGYLISLSDVIRQAHNIGQIRMHRNKPELGRARGMLR